MMRGPHDHDVAYANQLGSRKVCLSAAAVIIEGTKNVGILQRIAPNRTVANVPLSPTEIQKSQTLFRAIQASGSPSQSSVSICACASRG